MDSNQREQRRALLDARYGGKCPSCGAALLFGSDGGACESVATGAFCAHPLVFDFYQTTPGQLRIQALRPLSDNIAAALCKINNLRPEMVMKDPPPQTQVIDISKMVADNVNHPEHYTSGGIECIDAIKAALTPEEFRGFLKGNVMKYTWRERMKGGEESLRKAAWYLERLING